MPWCNGYYYPDYYTYDSSSSTAGPHTSTDSGTAGNWCWGTNATTSSATICVNTFQVFTVGPHNEPVVIPEENPGLAEEKGLAVEAAEELLKGVAGEEEYAKAQELGYYEVTSATILGRVYRVPKGPGGVYQRFIKVFQDGVEVDTLCVHPDLAYPTADIVLAQMVNLLYDEEKTLAIAGRHGVGAACW
jgi:hypothetical protein